MAKAVKRTVKRRTGNYSAKTFYFFYDWQSDDDQRELWELSLLQPERSHTSQYMQKPIAHTRQHIWYPGVKAWQLSHSTTYPLPTSSQSLSRYPHKARQKCSCLSGLMNAFTEAQESPLQPWPSVKVPTNRQVSARLVFSILHCQADLEKRKTLLPGIERLTLALLELPRQRTPSVLKHGYLPL